MTHDNQCHYAGHYTFSTDKRGKLAEFSNLITDLGLNALGTYGGYFAYCYVGAGNAAPTIQDTQMGSLVAATNATSSVTQGNATEAPYYAWRKMVYRFAQGAAAGTLAEVGIGFNATSVGNLFSRALIKDLNGDPVSLTILADEILEVTYELRLYINTTDTTGEVTFTGNKGGTYAWTMRPSGVTNNDYWAVSGVTMRETQSNCGVYSGPIGTVTQSPSGSYSSDNESVAAYVNNSLEAEITLSFGIGYANFETGIKSAYFRLGMGWYQVEFTPAIPKTNTESLSLTFKHSWGRKV